MLRGAGTPGQCGWRARDCHDSVVDDGRAHDRPSAERVSAERALGTTGIARRGADSTESQRASRSWWDADADDYLAEHGPDIGDADFVWGPEGLREADAGLLGDVAGAERLPFLAASFDLACSAFGAVPFVADPARVMAEVARVLRPGGRWVFAVNHPMRWVFPDDPGEEGLTVRQSYFDRTPYVEVDATGAATYVEHHRTVGDRIRDVVAAGLVLDDLVEPEWPPGRDRVWGQWSPLRGALFPGTAIFVCHRPAG